MSDNTERAREMLADWGKNGGAIEALAALLAREAAMRMALDVIAAQSSGKVGSTDRADCMAAIARVTLSTAPAEVAAAYKQCGRWADDSPGLRADCHDKFGAGRPCEKCPDAIRALPRKEV